MSKRQFTSYYSHVLAAVCLTLVFSSCGKDNDLDKQSLVPTKSKIVLNEAVAPEGCLSVPLYLTQLRSLNPGLSALEVTKHIEFSSKKEIRHNYEILTAFGAFSFANVSMTKLQQIQNVTQNACESFTITDANGTATLYKIKDIEKDRVAGQSDSGQRVSYHWLSDNRMEVITNTVSYDVPCGSELNPVFVELTKIYDWSGESLEKISTDSPLAVERSYLEKIAEATGHDVKEFYSTEEDGTQVLLASKLREIPALSPRDELLACSANPPPPPPGDNNGDGSDHSGDNHGTPPAIPGDDHGTPPAIPGDNHNAPPPTPHDGSVAGSIFIRRN
ncbi:MAG: hypothetical protein ACXWQO_04170 [Bdellovibrionota bacterium]